MKTGYSVLNSPLVYTKHESLTTIYCNKTMSFY
jgi:hypothetical protein